MTNLISQLPAWWQEYSSVLLSPSSLIFFTTGLLGLISIGSGAWFTYDTHANHPRYDYQPLDSAWKERLHGLIESSRTAVADASSSDAEKETAFVEKDQGSVASQSAPAPSIWVDVSGAVKHPGVYQLQKSARVQEAVLMAGGFAGDADMNFVHKSLNLAEQLRDARKLYIPYELESEYEGYIPPGFEDDDEYPDLSGYDLDADPFAGMPQAPAIQFATEAEILQFFNEATKNRLMEVDNIGEVRAKAIIESRPYTSIAEVITRAKIPQSILSSMQKDDE